MARPHVRELSEKRCELPPSTDFCIAVLGDLHMDPRKMEDYAEGKSHFMPILMDASERGIG